MDAPFCVLNEAEVELNFIKIKHYLWTLNFRAKLLSIHENVEGRLFCLQKDHRDLWEQYCSYIMNKLNISDESFEDLD